MQKVVSYVRVSTALQGRSGLGLDAQRAAVNALAVQRGFNVLAEFTEVESGKDAHRPELAKALHYARLTGSILVIAKLDRLSRNAAFLLTLRDSGIRFIAADIPDANDLTIGLLAVIAQAEREAISTRTKEALGAIKARLAAEGSYTSPRSNKTIFRLGNPNGAAPLRRGRNAAEAAAAARKRLFDKRVRDLKPIIVAARGDGAATYQQIADYLNARGIITARNRRWHPSSVRNVLKRLASMSAEGDGN
jgi:DNA invertase Pin-like site-specific DNA recombinase